MLCGRYCLEAASDLYSDSPSELVLRLCIETPTAGARVLEAGEEKFLQLADQIKSMFVTLSGVLCDQLD